SRNIEQPRRLVFMILVSRTRDSCCRPLLTQCQEIGDIRADGIVRKQLVCEIPRCRGIYRRQAVERRHPAVDWIIEVDIEALGPGACAAVEELATVLVVGVTSTVDAHENPVLDFTCPELSPEARIEVVVLASDVISARAPL